jgi:ATP-dependent Lon protease
MNSLVYLDEVDKIGSIDSSKGIEINGVLTHLLDKEQNHEFYDHYLGSKIPLDLSKILFIASFNNEYNMDPVVLNRMKVIKIKESSLKEKIQIVKNFTLPEIIKNLKLQEYDIYLSEKVIKYIIINKTVHEPGMRNINKNINTLIGKINTQLFLEKASKEELQKITKDLVYENVFLTRDGVNKIIVTNELVDMFVPMRMSAAVLSMYN